MNQMEVLRPEERVALALRSIYEQYGYRKYRMGKFEEYDFYARNKDFLASGQIITFNDLDGKLLALKPDVTLSIVKNTKASAEVCERIYYTENVYRVSRDVREFKELYQVGLEHIGRVDCYVSAEIITLALKSLQEINPQSVLELSHMGFIRGLFDAISLPPAVEAQAAALINEKNAHDLQALCAASELDTQAYEQLAALIALSGPFASVMSAARALCANAQMQAALDELQSLWDILRTLPQAASLRLDFSTLNAERYYNGLTMRGFAPGASGAVLSGGRYDPLLERMGKGDLQALGFAIYFDELAFLLRSPAANACDTLILYDAQSDPALVYRAVTREIEAGRRVWVNHNAPESMAYAKKIVIQNGVEQEELA